MNIDRNNYEIFFLDFLEGELTPEQVIQLMGFLSKNPDLKKELKEFEKITLEPESVVFENKKSLRKPENGNQITLKNFDNFCVAYIEHDLSPAEEQLLLDFLKQHPEKKTDVELYKKTKLKADKTIVFPFKSALKKAVVVNAGKKFLWRAASIAATILLFVWVLFMVNPVENKETATNKTKKIKTEIADSNKSQNNKKQNRHTYQKAENTSGEENQIPAKENKKTKKKIQVKTGNVKDNIAINTTSHGDVNQIEPVEPLYSIKNDISYQVHISAKPDFRKKPNESKTNYDDDDEYLSVKEYMKQGVKRKLKVEENKPFTFWSVAEVAVSGLSRITGKEIVLRSHYNEKGELESVIFDSKAIAIYAPVNR